MALTGQDDIVTKWTLDAQQFKDDLKNLAKQIHEQAAADKNAATVLQWRQKQMDAAAGAAKQLAAADENAARAARELADSHESLSARTVAVGSAIGGFVGNAASAGLSKAVDLLKDAAMESDRYVKAQNAMVCSVVKAKVATRGMVSELELM